MAMPMSFILHICEGFYKTHSMVFSNVPGPLTPYCIDGKLAKRCFFLAVGVEKLASGITFYTMADTLKMGIISDES